MGAYLNLGEIHLLNPSALTLASDTATPTQMLHTITSESSTSDNLATINITGFTQLTDGSNTYRPMLLLRATTGHTITVKHNTGNILLNTAADFTLTENKVLALIYSSDSKWHDLGAGGVGTIGGSSGSTDNRLIRADGTGGSTIQSSAVTLDDSGNLSGVNTLGLVDATELTIASGAITRTAGYHKVDTEADAGTDDLDTISGGTAGQKLIIRAENTARTVVIRHNGGGTGNIRTYDTNSVTLDETYKAVELIYDGTNWLVIGVVSSSGSIGGSTGATDNRLLRSDGTGGSTVQASGVTLDDSANMSGINTLGLVDATELTIASGAVTRTATYHRIDTEGDAGSDDLDTISGGTAGQLLIIRAENTARTVVVRHNGGGTGNIRTFDASNITLDETFQAIVLIYDGTNWLAAGVIDHTDDDAIHDNVNGEINAVASKASPVGADIVLIEDSAASYAKKKATLTSIVALASGGGGLVDFCDFRLTLSSGVPIMTSNVTAATTLYATPINLPHTEGLVTLKNGSSWETIATGEASVTLAGATASRPHDVFGYYDTGAMAIEILAWTNATTRATAIDVEDGHPIKSGDATRRWLGTIRITGTTGQCEFSPYPSAAPSKLFVWNLMHQVPIPFRVIDATNSWSYNTAAWQQANASGNNQIEVVVGAVKSQIDIKLISIALPNAYAASAIGEDSTSARATENTGLMLPPNTAGRTASITIFNKVVPLGYHYYARLEYGDGVGVTWYGDNNTPDILQSGMNGSFLC